MSGEAAAAAPGGARRWRRRAGWILLAFVLFRFFDILKPWPINWVEKRYSGGFGVMMDDVIAGVIALAVVQLIRLFV